MRLRTLTSHDLEPACGVLARAFQNDPLQSYCFPDPGERAARSPAHFLPILRYGLRAGEVWTTEDPIRGVALWLPPSRPTIDHEILGECGFGELPATIGQQSFDRFISILGHIDPLRHRDMTEPHWYLMVLGVDSSCQGQGVGSALLTAMHDRIGDTPSYLETAQPANVPFYLRHGYRILVHETEPLSGLPFWTFRRP